MPGSVPVHRLRPARHAPRAAGAGPDLTGDRGAVTIEAAIALCSLVVFLAVAMGSLVAVATSIRCIDAARELARLAARGEPDRGREVATALAPSGARLVLLRDDDLVVAEVSGELLRPFPIRISGRAVAALEPRVLDTAIPDTAAPNTAAPDTASADADGTGHRGTPP